MENGAAALGFSVLVGILTRAQSEHDDCTFRSLNSSHRGENSVLILADRDNVSQERVKIILLYIGDSVLPSLGPRRDGYSPDSLIHSVGIFAYILKFRISVVFF